MFFNAHFTFFECSIGSRLYRSEELSHSKYPTDFVIQTAAKASGIGPLDQGVIGLSVLVRDVLGVSMDKSQTMTDWRLRPMTSQQIEYAGNDVKYLFECM